MERPFSRIVKEDLVAVPQNYLFEGSAEQRRCSVPTPRFARRRPLNRGVDLRKKPPR
jgi:hypothetical protein